MNLGEFEVGLNIKELDNAFAFYQSLGFQLVNGNFDVGMFTLAKNDCRIAIYHANHKGFVEEMLYLQFYQGEVENIIRHAEGKGLKLTSPIRREDRGINAQFKDPDGRIVNLIQQPDSYRPDMRTDKAYRLRRLGSENARLVPDHAIDISFGRFVLKLFSEDVLKTSAFYLSLGFEEIFNDRGESCHLVSGDCVLRLQKSIGTDTDPEMIFEGGDLNAIAASLKATGIILPSLKDEEQENDISIYDPDGYLLRFIN